MTRLKSFNRKPLWQAIKENLLLIVLVTAFVNATVVWLALDLFAPDFWFALIFVGISNSLWFLLLLSCWWWQGETDE